MYNSIIQNQQYKEEVLLKLNAIQPAIEMEGIMEDENLKNNNPYKEYIDESQVEEVNQN